MNIQDDALNIEKAYMGILDALEKPSVGDNIIASNDTKINIGPRLRMTTLYAIAQSLPNGGRVCNTCNCSEDYVGYSTKFGDSAGDFSPCSEFTVTEMLEIGDALGLPADLVHKTPSDGLCGKSDEDRFGFTYDDIEAYVTKGTSGDTWIDAKIMSMHRVSRHKYEPMFICASDMTI
jgi:NAD+ synthase